MGVDLISVEIPGSSLCDVSEILHETQIVQSVYEQCLVYHIFY